MRGQAQSDLDCEWARVQMGAVERGGRWTGEAVTVYRCPLRAGLPKTVDVALSEDASWVAKYIT